MTLSSSKERNALADEKFGLPEKRAYPIPDASHAQNVRARGASQGFRLRPSYGCRRIGARPGEA
jgi:hypothetical protein